MLSVKGRRADVAAFRKASGASVQARAHQVRRALEQLASVGRYLPAVRAGKRGRRSGGRGHIVMLVISDLRIDPRVERSARTLAAAGYRVKVLFPDISQPAIVDEPLEWGAGVSFRPLPASAAGFTMEFPWLLGEALHRAACEEKPFAFHCHDLTTAIIGLSAARRAGAVCVCDFHEWYSENVSWSARKQAWGPHPWAKRVLYRAAERLVLARADAVITVCESIADDLVRELSWRRRRVHVIRNIPPLATAAVVYPPLKEQVNIDDGALAVLWQGGTGPSRLIEPIIEALVYAPRVVFVIRGPSLDLFGEGYRALARRCGVADRLVLAPPVPSADVVAAAHGADAGIWTLPKLSRNFYYALPNKIFEYIAAGLPVLAANFPEARKMVEGNGVGLCFDPYDPKSIAAQMNRLRDEPELAARLRAAIPETLRRIDAAREWQKLVDLYGRLERELPV